MAAPNHQLYTPEAAVKSTVAAVRYQSTLARTVSTDMSTEYIPGRGSVVHVPSPIFIDPARDYTAEDRAAETPITYSNLYQTHTSVRLGTQVYNAVKLPDDFMTFTLESLERQVIAPMAESVAERINGAVVDAFTGVAAGLSTADKAARGAYVDEDGTVHADLDAFRASGKSLAAFGAGIPASVAANLTATNLEDVSKAIRTAHQVLGRRGIPLAGRTLAVGANWEAALLALDNLNKVNEAGSPSVLRDATLGRLYGFTIVVDYALGANDAFAYQREAVGLATRTTALPRGAAFAATTAAQGFTLRYLQDYDPDYLTDRAVVDTFAGAQVLDGQRIVRLTGSDTMMEPAAAEAVSP